MAKCKVCNKKLDFDERDKSVQIGKTIREVKGELVEIPTYGKFPYIRRGRWYWHPECYDAPFTRGVSGEELVAAKEELMKLQKSLQVYTAENEKVLEEKNLYKNDYKVLLDKYNVLTDKNTALTAKITKLKDSIIEKAHEEKATLDESQK